MAGIDLSGVDPWTSVGGDMTGATSTSGSSAGSWASTLGTIGSAFGPVGSIAGGLIGSMFGGSDDDAAKKAYERQVDLTKWNQDFAREMSNTAMQRRVVDLIHAGLNPMLAATSGMSASSPEVGTAPVPYVSSGIAKANSAMKGAELGQAGALTAAELAKTMSETKLVDAQTAEVQARTPTYQSQIDLNSATIDRINTEIPKILADTDLTGQEFAKVMAEVNNVVKQGGLIDAQTKETLSRVGVNDATISNLQAKLKEIAASVGNLNASAAYTRAGIPYVGAKSDIAQGLSQNLHLPEASKFINSAGTAIGEGAARFNIGVDSFGDAVRNFFKPDSSRRNK